MARKHEHEDHVNHEAWAIPYGDLVTLLLAFFVVMYAVSSVNEGKYRVLSDSLTAAFRGTPRTMEPVPVGDKPAKAKGGRHRGRHQAQPGDQVPGQGRGSDAEGQREDEALQAQLRQMTDDLQNAMQVLIDQDMIRVQRAPSWVEVEIKTDILFPSGSAEIQPRPWRSSSASPGSWRSAPTPSASRGTRTTAPSRRPSSPPTGNCRRPAPPASSACSSSAASHRTAWWWPGMGENQPLADNASADGRNRNRRVALVILGAPPTRLIRDPAACPDSAARRRAVASPGTDAVPLAPAAATPRRHHGGHRMKPVDHVNADGARQLGAAHRGQAAPRREPEKDQQPTRDQKQPPGQDPDGRTHIIDELA